MLTFEFVKNPAETLVSALQHVGLFTLMIQTQLPDFVSLHLAQTRLCVMIVLFILLLRAEC